MRYNVRRFDVPGEVPGSEAPVSERVAKAAADAPAKATPAEERAAKNRNLLLRVATAVVLLPLVLWVIRLGDLAFAALLGVAALLNAVELHAMARKDDPLRVVAALPALALPFFFVVPELGGEANLHWLWAATALVALTWRLLRDAPVDSAGPDVATTVFAGVYASLLGYLMPLRQLGGGDESWQAAGWVILACALTWVGDTGAYFAGRTLGRHKLYPRISPAKTWEGFFGGLAGAVASAFVVRATLLPQLGVVDALVLGLVGGIAGPIGDLAESMLKRSYGVKDSGTILPGHGGMLDRVDALMVNAPLVYFYAKMFVLPRS